jgi:hypothetical protein
METIVTYLENVFKSLPKTAEVLKVKEELLANMEAKYEDLRTGGASDAEATARVIGEFGNIDELLVELGIDLPDADTEDAAPLISREEVSEFLKAFSQAALLIGSGVALIILGVATLISSHAVIVSAETIWQINLPTSSIFSGAMAFLLLLVACGTGLFIYAGFSTNKYQRFERGEFTIARDLKRDLQQHYDDYQQKVALGIIAGIALIFLGAAMIFIIPSAYASYSVALFMLAVACAVFIFVKVGMANGAYQRLLRIGDYSPQKREVERVVGAVAAFVFPAATCVFLVWGLAFDGWTIAWIVFPIVSILFGGFAGLYSVLKGVE